MKKSVSLALSVALTLFNLSCQTNNMATVTSLLEAQPGTPEYETDLKKPEIHPEKGFSIKSGGLQPGDTVPNQLIVKFNKKASRNEITKILNQLNAKRIGYIQRSSNMMLLEVPDKPAAMSYLGTSSSVDFTEEEKVLALGGYPYSLQLSEKNNQILEFSGGAYHKIFVYYDDTNLCYKGDLTDPTFDFTLKDPQGVTIPQCSGNVAPPSSRLRLNLTYNGVPTPIDVRMVNPAPNGNPAPEGFVDCYKNDIPAGLNLNFSWNGASYTMPNPPGNLSKCGPAPTPTPVPTATPTATPVPTATPSSTPVPTATPTSTLLPTATPSATPIPTAIPTSTPVPTVTPSSAAFINDPKFNLQYSHTRTQSVQGWQIAFGTNNSTIAIVDTGVDGNHPDLNTKLLSGYSAFVDQSPNYDPHSHGTHCAGVAAATVNNSMGIVGYAPNANIIPIKVLDTSGYGTTSTVAAGITFAANSNADVISLSLGGSGGSSTLQNAVNYAISKGKLLVAAMGNGGSNALSYPAAYNGVMAVGATDSNDVRAQFSQFGNHISVTAPGVNILSTIPGNRYGEMSGTSMATPAVSGLAALVKSFKPNLTAAQIKQVIEQNADDLGSPGFDQYYGYGRINTFKTLNSLR